jgi:hypothetical protein
MVDLVLKRKIKKLLKTSSRQKQFLNMKEIHTILVLFDTVNYEEVDTFLKQMKRMGKKVIAYAYKSKKDENVYTEAPFRIINQHEVSGWFNFYPDQLAVEIAKKNYDALFDLTIRENVLLEFLHLNVNAQLTVGYKKNTWFPYDLSFSSLEVEDDRENLKIRELCKQILHYLSTIKSA